MNKNIVGSPDALWVVVPVYDIEREPLRVRCLTRTLTSLQKQNVSTLVVEAAPANKGVVSRKLCSRLVTVPLSNRHAGLWQKEALCNFAETKLPDTCTRIVFCDADVIWLRKDWAEVVSALLEAHPFVQPFEKVEYERVDGTVRRMWNGRLRTRRPDRGVVGIVHAFRRDVFCTLGGYYDRAITGGGDEFAMAGMHPSQKAVQQLRHHKAILEDAMPWIDNARHRVGGHGTYAPLTIRHLWHGKRPSGYPVHRELEKVAPELDVRRDVVKQRNGLLAWRDPVSSAATHLRAATTARQSSSARLESGRERRSITVSAVLSQLRAGGAAMTIYEWIAAMQPRAWATGVRWGGVAVRDLRGADPWVLSRLADLCPVWAPRSQLIPGHPSSLVACAKWSDAVDEAREAADVIHPWGFGQRPPGPWDKPVVCVANGCGRRTTERLRPWMDHLAAGWALSGPAHQAVPVRMRRKFEIVRWALDRSRLLPSRSRAEIRRDLGVGPNEKILLWMGRLSPLKQPQRALRCIEQLPDEWRLMCLGVSQRGAWKPNQHHRRLIALGRVKMVSCDPHRIGDLLAVAAACIHTSNGEGGPRVAAEAWAAGVPLVSTPVGLVAERHNDALARIVPTHADGSVWAQAVQEATRDRHQVIRAQRWVNEHCDPDRQVKRLCKLFHAAAAPGATRSPSSGWH